SDTETFAFKNQLTRAWEKSNLRLVLDGIRSDTADDRFLLADPGQTFLPGDAPTLTANTLV
ncbi:MAG: hypothetical protein GTO05_06510, partial [Gemmatimonadales bacterium]|nr:hypothetical protein [Gemmatimonadales bacterium]